MAGREREHALDLPLTGVRVVDATVGWAGAIGDHLAELGADVACMDDRAAPPRDRIDAAGIAALLRDRRKRRSPPAPIAEVSAQADILILSPGIVDDVTVLAADHPGLIVVHASDFGLTGRHAGWQATGPVLHALSGELSRSGQPGREPLLPPGDLAYASAASQAAFGTLVAYLERLRTGRGDLLDFAALDGTVQALDPGYGIAGSATLGVPASKLPRGRPSVGFQYPILPCADGEVRIAVLAPRQWRGLFEWMGRPAEFADPSFSKTAIRFASPTLMPAITAFFADKTRTELEDEGARRGVPIAALRTLAEAVDGDQIRARRAFVDAEVAPGIVVPLLDGTFEIDGLRTGEAQGRSAAVPPARMGDAAARRPLEGLRVLDLGVIVVGAETGRLLGDQGADVIKVEAAAFPDGSRGVRNELGMSITVAAGHRNKRSLGINLRDDEGKALFRRLVAQSDIVLSNFKAGTMESLGLGHAELSAINPRIVMVDSSAYGSTGPWKGRLGYGPLVRAAAGMTDQWRYDDDRSSYSDAITVYPDHVAGRIGAMAALALLVRRERTGRGGTVGISQAEVMLSHMGPQIATAALTGSTRSGAEQPDAGPWGVFPCAGDDDWCVVTVRDEADRAALCDVIGVTDAAGLSIEPALLGWLGAHGSRDAMEALQAAGVPAGAMLRVSELPDFDYFQGRGLFRTETHPRLSGPLIAESAPVRSLRLPDPPERPAPIAGEHTAEIMRERLALDDDEIAALIARGVLEPPAAFGLA